MIKRIGIPLAIGLMGSLLLAGVYFGIVSIAESPAHALEFFWQDRAFVIPILLGFGVQAGLYTVLKMRLFLPVAQTWSSGALVGAGGTTSTLAMVACCAHHLTDLLPIFGLTAAAAFLGQYRTVFMAVGLGTTLLGIVYMVVLLVRERRKALRSLIPNPIPSEVVCNH